MEDEMVKDGFGEGFGAKSIAKGFITIDQFLDAMKVQVKEDLDEGVHRPLGKILVELEYMDDSQVKEVLESMGIFPKKAD